MVDTRLMLRRRAELLVDGLAPRQRDGFADSTHDDGSAHFENEVCEQQ